MKALEERLENTERALIALVALLEDTLPPAYHEDIKRMVEQFWSRNEELGGDLSTPGFDPRPDTPK